jgi:predicted nucleic acid-binding protein
VILADSSAWIEYLRATRSSIHLEIKRRLDLGLPIATTGVVLMEVLAGAISERHGQDLRRLLLRGDYLPMDDPDDFEMGANLYRQCRTHGETPRKMTDCLIAAVAIRAGLPVLHRDGDFTVLARHTSLTTIEP